MYASQEKRAGLPRHHPRDREASQASHHGKLDQAAESRDSGLGAISPAWGEQADLCTGRPSHLYPPVAVGAAETPASIPSLDSGPVLSVLRREQLGGLWSYHACQWEPYFEARLGVSMAHNLKGRRHLLRLWKGQDGLCAVCHQRITKLTGWHSHHLVWRTHGGADRAENRVLLPP